MGFPSVCYCVILPQPLILVLQLLDFLRHAVLLCLSSLGLAAPPTSDEHPAYAPPPDLWAEDSSSPSPSPSLGAAAMAMAASCLFPFPFPTLPHHPSPSNPALQLVLRSNSLDAGRRQRQASLQVSQYSS